MVTVRPLVAADRKAWSALYAGYAAFYEVEQTDAMRDLVWGWLLDPAHEMQGFLAVDAGGTAIGMAHYRPFARPLSASTGVWLDDLFVAPAGRGSQTGKKLIAAIAEKARENGWSVVRWITAEDNYRARGSYDKIATRTKWLTYDLKP